MDRADAATQDAEKPEQSRSRSPSCNRKLQAHSGCQSLAPIFSESLGSELVIINYTFKIGGGGA
jgi:hypothetical protein